MAELLIYNEVIAVDQSDIKKFIDNELTVVSRIDVSKLIESELIVSSRADISKFFYNEITVVPSPSKRETISSNAIITPHHLMNILSDTKIKVLGKITTILSNAVVSMKYSSDILSDACIFRQPKQTINSEAEIFHPHVNIVSDASILKTYIQNIFSDARILVHHKLKTLTNLTTKLRRKTLVQLSFITAKNRILRICDSNLTTMFRAKQSFVTDLRTKLSNYDDIQPKTLDSIIVKKDGIELYDVDYSTLKLQFNLGRTPSNASFILARYHDRINQDINGNTSIITNKNKIEIYDDTILLFIGYITQIKAESTTDTVAVVAEDARYKLYSSSYKIEYGIKYDTDSATPFPNYTLFSKSTAVAITEILDLLVSSGDIAGYDTVDFGFLSEYVENTSDCGSLLDSLISNSANVNWYIDAYEYVRFQKIESGTQKTLALSSINERRHLYDVIVDNINLNEAGSSYYSSLEVHLGKVYKKIYGGFIVYQEWLDVHGVWNMPPGKQDVRIFNFQGFKRDGDNGYGANFIGEGPMTYASVNGGHADFQWLEDDSIVDSGIVVIGSGQPKKIYYSSNSDKKISNTFREVAQADGPWGPNTNWLYESTEETYDYTSYALDNAQFELSQNNKLTSSATVTLSLDAFEYYNIKLNDLIGLSNTLILNFYNNQNGFPLNIENINIDCATRIVTLSLTNYGKTYYQRTVSALQNYQAPTHKQIEYQHSYWVHGV